MVDRIIIRGIDNKEIIEKQICLKVFPKRRKILVLINPFGGAGAAPGNWEVAREIFDLAPQRVQITVMETERANHAFEYVQQIG